MAALDFLAPDSFNKELKHSFDADGMKGIAAVVGKKINEWQTIQLNIGVTGRSGVGKSSFINAMIGLEADDDGGAMVGLTEQTTEAKGYRHPRNNNLVFTDLPGAGTSNFPKNTYLTDKRVEFEKYDLFILITADRFLEDDLWLVEEMRKRGKHFLFVRSKVGQDLRNHKNSRRRLYQKNEDDVRDNAIKEIRTNCKTNLKPNDTVYLIDNLDTKHPHLDFSCMVLACEEGLPKLKRDAFVLTMKHENPKLILEKRNALESRIRLQGVLSAIGGAVPIPGSSFVLDMALVTAEANFYRNQFGLDEATLKQTAATAGVSMEKLCKVTNLKSVKYGGGSASLVSFTTAVLEFSEVFEKTAAIALPIVGSLIGGVISYNSTVYALRCYLDMMVKDANSLNDYLTKFMEDCLTEKKVNPSVD